MKETMTEERRIELRKRAERRKTEPLFVIIGAKKTPNGSKVMCGADLLDLVKETLERLKVHPNTKDYGPFEIIPSLEAEKKKLYGD